MAGDRDEQLVVTPFQVHLGGRDQRQRQRQEIASILLYHGHPLCRSRGQDITDRAGADPGKRGKGVWAHRLVREVGGDDDGQGVEGMTDLGQTPLLSLVPAGQPGALARLRASAGGA